MIHFRVPRRLLTLAALLYLAAGFVWIGYEDQSARWVSLMGAGGALLGTVVFCRRRFGGGEYAPRQWLFGCALAGLAAGVAAAPMTIVLMALKVSLHSHATPDFTPGEVLAIIETLPVWGMAGLLLGAATGLVGLARRRT